MLIFIRIFAKIMFLQEVRSWKQEVFRSKTFILLFTYSPAFTTRFFRNFSPNHSSKKFLKRAQTNRSIGARNHYSFFFPLFYNILISILQGFRILEGLFTLKKIDARFARAISNFNPKNWLKYNIWKPKLLFGISWASLGQDGCILGEIFYWIG